MAAAVRPIEQPQPERRRNADITPMTKYIGRTLRKNYTTRPACVIDAVSLELELRPIRRIDRVGLSVRELSAGRLCHVSEPQRDVWHDCHG
jgi:hypothetical protein